MEPRLKRRPAPYFTVLGAILIYLRFHQKARSKDIDLRILEQSAVFPSMTGAPEKQRQRPASIQMAEDVRDNQHSSVYSMGPISSGLAPEFGVSIVESEAPQRRSGQRCQGKRTRFSFPSPNAAR